MSNFFLVSNRSDFLKLKFYGFSPSFEKEFSEENKIRHKIIHIGPVCCVSLVVVIR